MGSSNYITNIAGDVSQHMEYFAFGETFVEEHKNSINSPFKFNGKELDEESGLYYYGARYYDPRLSIWASVDPLANFNPFMDDEHYIDGEHNDGVFNHFNHASYSYCYQNPIKYIDPNGKQIYPKVLNIDKDKAISVLNNQNFDDRQTNNNYKLTVNQAATIIGHEGVNLTMYDQDGAKKTKKNPKPGNATIGIGHLIHKGRINGSDSEKQFKNGLTKDQVVKRFTDDLISREDNVNKRIIKLEVKVTADQYAVLVDIAFNKGEGNAYKILKILKSEGVEKAAKKIEGFDKGNKGLHLRRVEEAKLFRK